jgi:hypothetical protein
MRDFGKDRFPLSRSGTVRNRPRQRDPLGDFAIAALLLLSGCIMPIRVEQGGTLELHVSPLRASRCSIPHIQATGIGDPENLVEGGDTPNISPTVTAVP